MTNITKIFGAAWFCLAPALAATGFAADAGTAITPAQHIELFNGKDFTGWKRWLKDGSDVDKTWWVANGVLRNTGKPTGYIRTEQDYRDYKLTVEWRFVKVAPKADNSGVLVHMQLPDKLWPECIQSQGLNQKQGDLIYMAGAESKEHKGMSANEPVPKRGPSNEKPIGEWNTNVVVCAGDNIKVWVNGKLMNEGTECNVTSGRIGIQSEGADMEIRKMCLDPLPIKD